MIDRAVRLLPALLLALATSLAGCGDDAPRGKASGDADLQVLPFDQLLGERERDVRWLLPKDLLTVEGLESLASRLPADVPGVRTSRDVPTDSEGSGGRLDWTLLDTAPAGDVVLMALHGTEANVGFDWVLDQGLLGNLSMSLFGTGDPPSLVDRVSAPGQMEAGFKRLLDKNLGRLGRSLAQWREDWDPRFRGDALILLSRISDVWDCVEYSEHYYSEDPIPMLARTAVLPLTGGETLSADLIDLAKFGGFGKPESATELRVPTF